MYRFMYLQREGSFGGHLGYQPLFFSFLKLAEILLDEEGSVELPDCYLIICKNLENQKQTAQKKD